MRTATSDSFLETLPKPTIWAEPSSVVAHGRPVNIWCQGSQRAGQYYLYEKSVPQLQRRGFLLESRDKAKFPIPLMTQDFAGTYHCMYHRRRRWSFPSEPLDLVVAGEQTLPLAQVMGLCPRKVLFPQPGLLDTMGVSALFFHFLFLW